jgi:hypothetical protein
VKNLLFTAIFGRLVAAATPDCGCTPHTGGNTMSKNTPPQQLERDLQQYIGTTQYHAHMPGFVLTDGALYLAANAGCFWLFDLFCLDLMQFDSTQHFATLKLERSGTGAKVVIDDGDQNIQTKHRIEFTDFPLAQITLFACRDERFWVVMLPGEY